MEEGQQDEFKATSEVNSAATMAELGSIKETGRALAAGAAHPIATNIKLLSACLEALPDILSGADTIPMLRAQLPRSPCFLWNASRGVNVQMHLGPERCVCLEHAWENLA